MSIVIDGSANDVFNRYGIQYFYHITHISNVDSILEHGLYAHLNAYKKRDISNQSVNARRASREPIFRNPIHSYVPFYFNPKNAMLYVKQDIQENLVILAFKRDILLDESAIFTDGNAAVGSTRFFDDLNDLSRLNWNCLNAPRWNGFPDGKRERMAEVLVHGHVDSNSIAKIICYTKSAKRALNGLFDNVSVDRNYYF
ncbi:MAG: DUF4433 domain-containing protein [Sulfurovaceae bacterium]|nr:DUF4433 domain-containing protein [Sulfurovaceae bacterium]